VPLPDAADRRRAVTDFTGNLVVTAGAGTGKTALLVERALNLIAGHGVEIESLAAITFTDKAAAELKLRLAGGLEDLRALAARRADPAAAAGDGEAARSYAWLAGEAGVAPETIAGRALAALLDLDAAVVSTIHAFCVEILKRHPTHAGVDPGFAVDEGAAFDALFETEARRAAAVELGIAAPRAPLWRRVLERPDGIGAVRDIARHLGSYRIPGAAVEPDRPYAPPPAKTLLGAGVESLLRDVARLRRDGRGMNPNMALALESEEVLLTALLEGGPEALATAAAPWSARTIKEKDPAPGKKLSGIDAAELVDVHGRVRKLLSDVIQVDEAAIAPLVDAARPLGADGREALLRAGFVSFDGLLRLTRDLLAARPALRRALAARWRTILLDEFQDTDPLQYEILFFLAEAPGASADDAWRTRLEPGRLFIVGDPKQSIYRFRGADIEAYERAVARVLECGGARLVLSASFRSPGEVVEPIDRMFRAWMKEDRDAGGIFQPRYEPIVSAAGPAAPGADPRVEIWRVEAEGDATARRRAEAAAIAGWIAARAGIPGPAVGPGPPGASPAFGGIALLLRSLNDAGLYTRALRRAGIPFVVDGGKDFYERPEVGDLLSLLRAIANPNDGAAILAVLRSPLGGCPDEELARFAAAGGRLDRAGEPAAGGGDWPSVTRTLRLIEALRGRLRGAPADDVVRAAMEETPLLLLHASAWEGSQRVANLEKLVAEAETLARRGLSLEEILGVLEDQFRTGKEGAESPLADETVDAVRVLTIHKAKGLEFPVVFVPDLARRPPPGGARETEVEWLPLPGGGTLAIRLTDGTRNLARVRRDLLDARHAIAEEQRVFYVACTRARERLVLIDGDPGARSPTAWVEALGPLGYDRAVDLPDGGAISPGVRHRRIAPAPPPVAAPAAAIDPAWGEAATRFASAAAAAAASARPPLRWPTGGRDAGISGAGEADAGPAVRPRSPGPGREVARLAGSAVHAALERWDFRDPRSLRDAARHAAEQAAAERGPGDDASLGREAAAEAAAIVEAFLAGPLPRRLAGLEVLGREVPILFRDAEGATWTGACDLLYREAGGTLVVADYKTDRIEGDPVAAAAAYREQVAVYLEAVRRVFPESPVRAEILFLRTGAAVTVPPTPTDAAGPPPSRTA
jgi:ATP-dependent helicase/nuclease subunit A